MAHSCFIQAKGGSYGPLSGSSGQLWEPYGPLEDLYEPLGGSYGGIEG